MITDNTVAEATIIIKAKFRRKDNFNKLQQ